MPPNQVNLRTVKRDIHITPERFAKMPEEVQKIVLATGTVPREAPTSPRVGQVWGNDKGNREREVLWSGPTYVDYRDLVYGKVYTIFARDFIAWASGKQLITEREG